MIAEATRRLVGDLFEVEDLGAQQLKGIAGTMRAYKVINSRSVESSLRGTATFGTSLGHSSPWSILIAGWG